MAANHDRHSILFLVTGASRGLGRSIALAFQQHFLATSDGASSLHLHFSLVARSQQGLEETRQQLEDQAGKGKESSSSNISIDYSIHSFDLGDLANLETNFNQVLNKFQQTSWSQFILINNAGSLGSLGPCWNEPQSSLQHMQAIIDFNVTSALWIATKCLHWVLKEQTNNRTPQTTMVNVSSLTAIQAFPSMGLYSAGKAARDMFHACMEQELSSAGSTSKTLPPVKVLNYAPGPLETDMTEEIRRAPNLDVSLKPHYDKRLVDANDSAKVLVTLVAKNEFTSGSHVDYYDCL